MSWHMAHVGSMRPWDDQTVGSVKFMRYALVMMNSLLLKTTIYSEFLQYEWWFSIAMSNYQMVYAAVSETDFAAHGMLAASQLQTS